MTLNYPPSLLLSNLLFSAGVNCSDVAPSSGTGNHLVVVLSILGSLVVAVILTVGVCLISYYAVKKWKRRNYEELRNPCFNEGMVNSAHISTDSHASLLLGGENLA